jgi:hypothetical protein
MRETFTVTLTVDHANRRIQTETKYPSGNQFTMEPVQLDSVEIVNSWVVLFIQAQTKSFGERCIHLVNFGTVEEPANAN